MFSLKSYKVWVLLSAVLIVSLGVGFQALQNSVSGQDERDVGLTAAARDGQSALPRSAPDPASLQHANQLSEAFRQAALMATSSVVKIRSVARARTMPTPSPRENPFKGTPFEGLIPEDLFRDLPGRIPQRDGVGSGVIVDPSGIVITNNHVVAGADELTVTLADGREFKVDDVKTDPQSDLAVLRLKGAKNLPAARLGDSDRMEIGDWVIAIGNPFDLEMTVSAGIISGKGRELGSIRRAKFLQTDAAINPGNSGGPLVNLEGEVIGINTAIASNSGAFQGIGFAIPSNLVKWVTDQLIHGGTVQRGYLGVAIEQISADLAQKFGVRQDEGVLVSEVFADTPAAAAGVQDGDVILSFGGQKVGSPRQLQEAVERAAIGSEQTLEVLRDGRTHRLKVVVKALPEDLAGRSSFGGSPRSSAATEGYWAEELGLEVRDRTDADVARLGDHEGVVVTRVDEEGPAAAKGIQPGMLIRRVEQTPVKNVTEFAAALKGVSIKEGVLLQVRTERGSRWVVLKAE